METGHAQQKLEQYLQGVITNGRFELQYTVASEDTPAHTASSEPDAGSPARAPVPGFAVNFSGPDVPLLTARNGELLHAVESIAAELLGLEPGEHHRLVFDADGFRAERTRSLEQAVEQACENVLRSGRPHAFPPMNARERRLIHLAAASHGISTASSGEGPRRNVVLYPAGQAPAASEPDGNSARSLTLPGESRVPRGPSSGFADRGNRGSFRDNRGNRGGFGNRPAFGGNRDDDRGNRFASARSSGGGFSSSDRPSSEPQTFEAGEEPTETGPSAEDRARAIRERFRKR